MQNLDLLELKEIYSLNDIVQESLCALKHSEELNSLAQTPNLSTVAKECVCVGIKTIYSSVGYTGSVSVESFTDTVTRFKEFTKELIKKIVQAIMNLYNKIKNFMFKNKVDTQRRTNELKNKVNAKKATASNDIQLLDQSVLGVRFALAAFVDKEDLTYELILDHFKRLDVDYINDFANNYCRVLEDFEDVKTIEDVYYFFDRVTSLVDKYPGVEYGSIDRPLCNNYSCSVRVTYSKIDNEVTTEIKESKPNYISEPNRKAHSLTVGQVQYIIDLYNSTFTKLSNRAVRVIELFVKHFYVDISKLKIEASTEEDRKATIKAIDAYYKLTSMILLQITIIGKIQAAYDEAVFLVEEYLLRKEE